MGYKRDEFYSSGFEFLSLIAPESHQLVTSSFSKHMKGEEVEPYEYTLIAKDGRKIEAIITTRLLNYMGGRAILGIVTDISKRKAAEEALRFTQFSIDRAADAAFWMTRDARFFYVNEVASRSLGYSREELLSMHVHDIDPNFPEETWQEHWQEIKHRGSFSFESSHKAKDGRIVPVEITVNFLQFAGDEYNCAFARDITERKRLEEQLLWSQKMETVGRLAGGVAHDFNNILTTIVSHAELALRRLQSNTPPSGDLNEILRASERAVSLTQQLLAFSRRQIVEPKVIGLNDVLSHTDKMLRRLLGEDIELVTLPADNLDPVRVDPNQIEQVIVNLAVNARDAMPEGGKLILETTSVTLDENYARQHLGVTPGEYVMLAVSDTGVGMSEEVKAHIFEPFFTTKDRGKGTGLGLATCYGIVRQAGGHIWVYSELGRGTTFKIYLPKVHQKAEPLGLGDESGYLPRGTETVLLVEDEHAVRKVAAQVLREQGYTVLEAANGEEALRMTKEHSTRDIHLLVADVVMPQMGGKALVEKLRGERPEIKVLFISGYADNAFDHCGVLDSGTAFLQKPFSPLVLARKVRDVLHG